MEAVMIKLDDIELFCRIVEGKSFTAASIELGISRSLVSKRLTGLERRLGVSLIARSTRRLSLTEAGQRYYEHCQMIDQYIQDAEAHTKGVSQTANGVVKVSAPTLLGWRLLPSIVEDLPLEHPNLTVDYQLSDQYVDIIGDGYDVAIRLSSQLADSNLIASRIGSTEIVVCGAPSYFARKGFPETTQDLTKHQCLSFGSWGGFGRVWKFSDLAQPTEVMIGGRLISNSDLTLFAACRMGAGLVFTPKICIENELASGELTVVLENFTQGLDRGIYAVFPKHEFRPKKTTVFVDFIKACIANLGGCMDRRDG